MFPTLIPLICHEIKQLKLVNHQFFFQLIFHDPNKNNDDLNYIGHHCYRNICLCNYQTIIRGHEEIEQIIPVMDNNNGFCEVIDFAISDNYCDALVLLTAEGVPSLLVCRVSFALCYSLVFHQQSTKYQPSNHSTS